MKKQLIFVIVTLIIVLLAVCACAWYDKMAQELGGGQLQTTTTTTSNDGGGGDEKPNPDKKLDFTVYDENGEAHRLSDYFGKPIVLNFWASWCPPCKAELPDFESKYKELLGEVQFLMVNVTDGYNGETVAKASKFIADNGYTFPVLYDTKSDATHTFGVYSYPQTFFIDKDGNVIARATGMISITTLQNGIDMIK